MAIIIKKYNVVSRTLSTSALTNPDLIEALQKLGFDPSSVLVEVNQNIPQNHPSAEQAVLHLQEITANGLVLDGARYVVDRTTASLARKATLVYMREDARKAIEDYTMCGLKMEIFQQKKIAINKLMVYKGLELTVSRPFSSVFGRKLDIRRVCVYDDCEIEFEFDAKVVKDGACVTERRTTKLKVTDGQILIRDELIGHVTHAFILRSSWMKGLCVGTSFDWFDAHGVYAIVDHFGRRMAISDIDAFVPMSAFKMGAYYDSWDQYVNAFEKDGHEVRVALMQHYPKYASLSYQVLQTLIGADAVDLDQLADETVDILNGFNTSANAAKLPGGELAQACKLYPELMAEPYTRETIETAYRRRRGEARGGRVFRAGQFRFLATDPIAIFEHLAGMKPEGMIGAHQVIANNWKLGDATMVRYPHLNVNFANVEVVRNPDPRYYTGYTIYVSAHDLIALLLRADYDGDKAFIMNDPKMLSLIHKTQALWNEIQVDWDAPGAAKQLYTKRAVYEYATALTGVARVGVHSNNATRAWARIWDMLQSGCEIPDGAKDAIAWLEMAANVDIDAAKNAGADLKEPLSVYQWHGRVVSNGYRLQRGENDMLPAALFYARNEDAQYRAEHEYLMDVIDQHNLCKRGYGNIPDPLLQFELKDPDGLHYYDNGTLRHLCIAVVGGQLKVVRHPEAPDYQKDSGLINCWSRIIERRAAKDLHIEGEENWCFTPSMMMIPTSQTKNVPGLVQRGRLNPATGLWEGQGVWQQYAFAHKEELQALVDDDASPAVYADYKAYRKEMTLKAIRGYAEANGFTLEDAYNYIVLCTFKDSKEARGRQKGYFDTLKRAFWDIFGEMAVQVLEAKLGHPVEADRADDIDFDISEELCMPE